MTTSLPEDVAKRPSVVSANDALVDLFMERGVDLLRLEAGTRDKVLALLNPLEDELAGKIAAIDPTAPARVAYQQQRLQSLLKEVQSSIKATYRVVSTKMAQEVRNVSDIEAAWTGNAINAAIKADFADAGLTSTMLETLVSNIMIQGAPSSDWWGRQAQGLANAFADQMRHGMAAGETNAQLIQRVRGTATQRGVMDVSRSSAERLVRASVQTAANAARQATYKQNSDLIASLMWHATLDTRTSTWCITRDGHHYSNDADHTPMDDGPDWLQGPGALHWGCRSTSIPVLKSWRDLGIDEDEVPHTTRASMDGQVPASTTFESWLKNQSNVRQDTVLGSTVADLWRQGKLSFRDLLNQNGRPLTVEELKAKAAKQ